MSDKPNLLQRLQAVMLEPGADYIQKSQKKINNQYTAVRHDDIADKLHPLFAKHGVLAIPSVMPETVHMIDTGRKTSKSNPIFRFEAIFDVGFYNVDDITEVLHMLVPAHADDEGDKAPGKAVSYATKTALLKALMIASGDEEEERVDGEAGGSGSGDSESSTTTSPPAMDADDKATLLKQMGDAPDVEKLGSIFKSAMAAAKEAGDSNAAAEFKAASIKRAELLKNPEAKGAADEVAQPAPASAAIIKTLRKAMQKKSAEDNDVLAAIKGASKGTFSALEAISNEAAVWVMNEYLKKLETASA